MCTSLRPSPRNSSERAVMPSTPTGVVIHLHRKYLQWMSSTYACVGDAIQPVHYRTLPSIIVSSLANTGSKGYMEKQDTDSGRGRGRGQK